MTAWRPLKYKYFIVGLSYFIPCRMPAGNVEYILNDYLRMCTAHLPADSVKKSFENNNATRRSINYYCIIAILQCITLYYDTYNNCVLSLHSRLTRGRYLHFKANEKFFNLFSILYIFINSWRCRRQYANWDIIGLQSNTILEVYNNYVLHFYSKYIDIETYYVVLIFETTQFKYVD